MNNYCNNKNYLTNSLFSEPVLQNNQYKYFNGNEVNGWIFNNVAIINNSIDWGYPTPYPCGNQACSIQYTGSISQTFTLEKTGQYMLIIAYCGRNCCDQTKKANTLNINLNGKKIDSIVDPVINSWKYKIINLQIDRITNNLEIIGTSQTDKSTGIQLILTDLNLDIITKQLETEKYAVSEFEPTTKVNFVYDSTASPVYVIGNYGVEPWGKNNTYTMNTTSNDNIKWIWYSDKSNINSPINNLDPITIQYIYSNKSNSRIQGKLNIMIDNTADVYLNSKLIGANIVGGWVGQVPMVSFILEPGENLFEFKVKNIEGGPAGLLVNATSSEMNTTQTLFYSNESWKFIPQKVKPIISCNLSINGLISTSDKSFPFGCLILSGVSTQYVDLGILTTGTTGLSFSCWFRSNNNANFARIFDLGNDKNNTITLYISNNKLGADIILMDQSYNLNITNLSPEINDNKWNHVVWTIQPISSKSTSNPNYTTNYTIYLNNHQVSSTHGVYPINMERKNCYLGKSNKPSDPFFNGAISNFVMYQKALTISEVNTLYYGIINLFDPNIYIYLPFSINSVLDTLLNNYVGKSFNLPTTKSKISNENWNCLKDGDKWISVKNSNNKPMCMSLDGKNCISMVKNECEIINNNPIGPQNPIICTEEKSKTKNNWCYNAKMLLDKSDNGIKKSNNISNNMSNSVHIESIKPGISALNSLEENSINLKVSVGKVSSGKVLSLEKLVDIDNLMIGGIFKLRVNLPLMPPYIKGKSFDITKGVDPNYFYLSVEKLDNNCEIKAMNGRCISVFADNKKCNNKSLTTYTDSNTYRLVLVSAQYALDPAVQIGSNSDFTLVKVNNHLYLKNVQTGYLPSLYSDETNVHVYGDMEVNSNSNINKIYSELNNTLCDQEEPPVQTSGTSFVKCNIKSDPKTYLMCATNIGNSSPIRPNINPDKTISLNLLSFNTYGHPTKVYGLTYCNFNVKTFSYIEKITNTLGTFMVNMVCFEDTKNNKANIKNQLKFTVELISFPNNFIKDNSIFDVN